MACIWPPEMGSSENDSPRLFHFPWRRSVPSAHEALLELSNICFILFEQNSVLTTNQPIKFGSPSESSSTVPPGVQGGVGLDTPGKTVSEALEEGW